MKKKIVYVIIYVFILGLYMKYSLVILDSLINIKAIVVILWFVCFSVVFILSAYKFLDIIDNNK